MTASYPAPPVAGQHFDVAIVGAGVVGLWCAREAMRAGLKAVVIERNEPGAGASGGVIGALMPNRPVEASAKQGFQLDGLLSLPAAVAALEAETGIACGYRRCGRLVPLREEDTRIRHAAWATDAERLWPALPDGERASWGVSDDAPFASLVAPDAAPFGFSHDTFSARIRPRAYVAALAASIAGHVAFMRATVLEVQADGRIDLEGGGTVVAGRIILANGFLSFGLANRFGVPVDGDGVKGQSALLRPRTPFDPATPILFDGSIYVIAHDDGMVAVGSTSETAWEETTSTDDRLNIVIGKAQALCPALLEAEIVERWAGVRPRSATRSPLVGPLPGAERLILATGGYKITLAIAHMMGKAAVEYASGGVPMLPAGFDPATCLKR